MAVGSRALGRFLVFFTALLALVSSGRGAALQDPEPTFRVHAYAGMIAKNGGKCLDYQPEVTGSPIFLNDCSVAHAIRVETIPNQRFEVFLRAGTKVIGVRRPPIIILSGESAASADELPLELQNPATEHFARADQTFALDGDSIILASDRKMVAKVHNARGANGTPIVLGTRQLSIEEFWDMRATDGSLLFPTNAFKRITTTEELLATLSTAGCPDKGWACPPVLDPGHVLVVEGTIELPEGLPPFQVPERTTIRGDRRGATLASRIIKASAGKGLENMFNVDGHFVRITGLHLRGPSRSSSGDQEQSNGIFIPEFTYRETIVDHNDISDWTWRGVYVLGDQDKTVAADLECTDVSIPRFRTNTTWIARNFIHHNRQYEKGYGVNVNSGAFPLIDGNLFVENRHAIAGTASTSRNGYRAWHNFVLIAVPLQAGVFHTHDFDMHGTGSGGKGGRAGGYMDLYRNTFMGTNRHNFEIRGTPCDFVEFRNNVSRQSFDDALSLDVGLFGTGMVKWIMPDEPEQFELPDPTAELGVGDFDGDGVQDLFLATGTAWYYSPHGNAEWRLINDNADRIETLKFGDFDNDGRTDVLGKNGVNLVVSWGGVSEWEKVNEIDAPLSDLAVADFDASGQADIFYTDGQSWFISYDNGPFVFANTSGFKVADLRFGDFNGDKRTDVFGVVSNAWRVSYSGVTAWEFLRAKLTDTVDTLTVADFDGNGTDDVASVTEKDPLLSSTTYRWRVSLDGRGSWTTLLNTTTRPPAAVGYFVEGDPRAGLLIWDENTLWRANLGSHTTPRHARQHMR